jgi:type VI secretion system protein ImpH
MEAPLGRPDSALTATPLERRFSERPQAFAFFQAVRLLERYSGRRTVGTFAPPAEEAARFGGNPTLGFPTSEIRSLEARADNPPLMRVSFFGLYGALGVLPDVYTEFILERAFHRDHGFRDFLDIFNHRLLSLLHRAWLKYRFVVGWERTGDEPVTRELLSLLGLGTPGLRHRQSVQDEALIFYAGLLARQARSAAGLEALVGDYFDVPVKVIPFAGAWRTIDAGSRTAFDGSGDASLRLGEGAVIGDEVWDQQSTARLRLGPLSLERYHAFLPAGDAHAPLRALCRFYCGENVDIELQLVLDRHAVPGLGLEAGGEPARLGWVSWIVNATPGRDPDDTVLRLWSD